VAAVFKFPTCWTGESPTWINNGPYGVYDQPVSEDALIPQLYQVEFHPGDIPKTPCHPISYFANGDDHYVIRTDYRRIDEKAL
jgi:hypothetical protein